jgi:signal transduction histidine kinase/CheY-like chemotaxis protein
MSKIRDGTAVNLEILRSQLTGRLALLLMSGCGLIIWATLRLDPFSWTLTGLLAVLFCVGLGVRVLLEVRSALARHLLIWGLTAGLLGAMWFFVEPWIPFLGLLMVSFCAMLTPGGTLMTTSVIALVTAWLTGSGFRSYPLTGFLVALASNVVLAWLTMRTLYTALEWAWTMQQRSDQLLDQVRDRQAELNRTVKSLDLAYALQRRTQHELVFARQQAEEAQRMKEQFAANVSHELRTPLSLILGFSEVMYLSPEVYGDMHWPPTLRRDVYQIYRSSRHLLEMIDDILDLSRFEMVGFTLNKEPTLLEPLLRETVEIARDLFRSSPVRLEVVIPKDLPALEIDRTRIRQVLLNLLSNAQRFTKAGTVRLETRQTDSEVIVSIIDTGPGISADKQPYIFDEFYQVDRSLRRSHQGAGLGLAICKRFVKAHEGRIWVESQEGVGSTFFFALPIPGRYVPASPAYVRHVVQALQPEGRSCILVIDPDPAVAALLRRHVEEYDVLQVKDASRLAEKVAFYHPRAVIYNVPPGERDFRDDLPPVPVPFVECSLPSQTWVRDELNVSACLTKPIATQQLLDEIDRLGDIHEVLIIDDDRGFVQLVERTLETTGRDLRVRHAYNGREGLSAMRALRPDLVLLDLIMPGLDGFQVIEEVHQEPALADVPIALLTAISYAEDTLVQRGSQIVIHRPDNLHLTEILRCLWAVIDVLEPHYDERSVPEEALVGLGV